MQVERNWLNPDGIPGRPWFKHILYGARFTYAHLELPGLTEAVEKQDWPTANQQAEILRQALVNNTKLVNELNCHRRDPERRDRRCSESNVSTNNDGQSTRLESDWPFMAPFANPIAPLAVKSFSEVPKRNPQPSRDTCLAFPHRDNYKLHPRPRPKSASLR